MSQPFTILWIEDKERVITSQEREIRDFLGELGFELNLLTDTQGDAFSRLLDENPVDVVIVDYNLSEDFKGSDVIKIIREKGLLIDVLFYSVIEDVFKDKELYEALGHYGFVVTHNDKDVIIPLRRLIEKNIRRCQDIIFLRGLVITRVIDIELQINEFLGRYFKIPAGTINEFYDFILENKYNPLGGKVVTLENIVKSHNLEKEFKGWLQEIRQLSNARNELAHCKADPDNKNCLISMGTPKIYDRGDIYKILEKIKRVSENLDKLVEKVC